MDANTMIFLAFISVLLMGRIQSRVSISFSGFDVTAFEFVYFGGRKVHGAVNSEQQKKKKIIPFGSIGER